MYNQCHYQCFLKQTQQNRAKNIAQHHNNIQNKQQHRTSRNIITHLVLHQLEMITVLVTTTLTIIEYSDTRPLEFLLSEPTAALLSVLWSSSAQMFVAHVFSE